MVVSEDEGGRYVSALSHASSRRADSGCNLSSTPGWHGIFYSRLNGINCIECILIGPTRPREDSGLVPARRCVPRVHCCMLGIAGNFEVSFVKLYGVLKVSRMGAPSARGWVTTYLYKNSQKQCHYNP